MIYDILSVFRKSGIKYKIRHKLIKFDICKYIFIFVDNILECTNGTGVDCYNSILLV